MIGEVIGNFKIVSRLGRGGMGEVFLAEQQKIGTKVAIKLLLPELSQHKQHVDRFFNEALAVSKIKHAGIVKIFDVGVFEKVGSAHPEGGGSLAYLIMEFLEGESLAGRIARVGRLPLAQLCDVGRQIASILEATHGVGTTHRDLKPDNIFLVGDVELASRERVKILDFGIAKLTGTLAGASPKTMGTMGTPAYMAPEQWGDASKVTWRADAYSLGCLAFEMATGRVPFLGENFAELYVKHLQESPPALRSLVPELPETLERLVLDLLAKRPEDRPSSMGDIASRFDAAAKAGTTPGAVAAASPSRPAVPVPPTVALTEAPAIAALPALQSAPPASSSPAVASKPTLPASTTLDGGTGQIAQPPKRSRTSMIAALGAIGVLGGGTAIYLATRDPEAQPVARPELPRVEPDAAVVVERPSPPGRLRDRIEAVNPFVDAGGAKLQAHQVTAREYRMFVDSLPDLVGELRPLDPPGGPAWDPKAPVSDEPVAWVTYDRALAFCKAVDAALPTDAHWVRAAAGSWGLDPGKRGTLGPLEEWTGTLDGDGLALVRGGHAKMSADDQALATESPMHKLTEAKAPAGAPANVIASAVIGFRCAR